MKKFVSVLLCLFSFQTFAFTASDVATAQLLADQKIIINHSENSLLYSLDKTITRAELLKIALKIKKITVPENYDCQNYFRDVSQKLGWICPVVEIATDEGMITRENTTFRPKDTVTRAEALAILMKAGGIEIQSDCGGSPCEEISIDSTIPWHQQIFRTAYYTGIVTPYRTIQELEIPPYTLQYIFRPQVSAKRSEVFSFANNIISLGNEVTTPVVSVGTLTSDQINSVIRDSYIQGNKDATLLLVEYADIECPYCKQMHDQGIIQNLQKKYGSTFAYSFKHYPLSFHPLALPAAYTAECIGEQGSSDAYYAFIDQLFSKDTPSQTNIDGVLEGMKYNNDVLKKCVQDKKFQDKIHTQIEEGTTLFAIQGTPSSVIINTKTGKYEIVAGLQPEQNFIDTAERLLK